MCAFGMTVVLQWISLCNSGAFFGNPTVQGMPLWLGQFALAWAYTAGSAGRVAGVYHKLLNGKLWVRSWRHVCRARMQGERTTCLCECCSLPV